MAIINNFPSVGKQAYQIDSGTFESEVSGKYQVATIELGYRPKAVIIKGTISTSDDIAGYSFDSTFTSELPITFSGGYTSFEGSANKKWTITITDTGFEFKTGSYSVVSTYSVSATYMVIK